MKKILLQGYYGFGNLGDDILLLVCYSNFRQHFPDAELVVFSNADPNIASYLHNLLGERIRTVNYTAREHFDIIIHGGGGVHYDYEEGRYFFSVLNRLIKLQPSWFTKLFDIYKKFKRREHITGSSRIGVGIGIGTFTASSKKFYSNLVVLNSYDFLLVRDSVSLARAKKISPRSSPRLSTDLAFYTEYWHPPRMQKKAQLPSKKIGVVLRHWKTGSAHTEEVIRIACRLESRGYEVTFFSFEAEYDKPYLNQLPVNVKRIIWPDSTGSLDAYLNHFYQQDLVVSTRFHGAILAATFGIPAIALVLEPKILTLKEILPQSIQLLNMEEIAKFLESKIFAVLSDLPSWQQKVRNDCERNYELIKQGLAGVNDFICSQK